MSRVANRECLARLGGRIARGLLLCLWAFGTAGCLSLPSGKEAARHGDEIMVCGRLFHTGTPVVLWTDPGGYDAYRVEKRFGALTNAELRVTATNRGPDSPNRYGLRRDGLSREELEQVRGGGWDLPLLQRVVDQFVLHYDACGTSRRCFQVLHDDRGLSVHFLLDVDGTIYQTLDLKERAWHATTSNSRSVGIEIAQVGAFSPSDRARLEPWYETHADRTTLRFPAFVGETGIRTPGFVGRPARAGVIEGRIQGRDLVQYDFTAEQYEALARLTATLCRLFPKLVCDYPRDARGELVLEKLPDDRLQQYSGLLGHYHIQTNKTDPGPAFDWEYLRRTARKYARWAQGW